jgi:hypothetical protein
MRLGMAMIDDVVHADPAKVRAGAPRSLELPAVPAARPLGANSLGAGCAPLCPEAAVSCPH